MNIALIGPSGGGKGTHVAPLERAFRLAHLSTGDLFRENLQRRSALGILARKYMDRGELVPDEVVEAMIEERLAAVNGGILFDGFPRTVEQARFLDAWLKDNGRTLEAAVYLEVPDEQIIQRLAGRLVCRQCQTPFHESFHPPRAAGRCDACGGELYRRPDDLPAMVSTRLRVFHRVTGPLVEYYYASHRLIILNGEGTYEQVHQAIVAAFDAVLRHEPPLATAEAFEGLRRPIAPVAPPREARAPARLDLVLLGGPGSGKGTQAEQLSRQLRLPHIATGDLFRENLKQETDLGKLAKTYMNRGELVPDDVTEAMVQQRLTQADTAPGFILDGFPRTLPQAMALTEMLTGMGRSLSGVVCINVPDEAIVNRLSGRLICRQCQAPYHAAFKPPAKAGVCDSCGGPLYQRDDDNPTTVRARLKTFHAQTEPLISYYQKAGLLQEVDGTCEVAAVTASVVAAAQRLPKT